MISDSVLQILVCPQTKQPLTRTDKSLIETVGNMVNKGLLQTIGGRTVADKPIELLLRQDKKVAYPICDGIPVLLVEEGIDLSSLES